MKKRLVFLLMFAALLVLLLTSCKISGVTIEARIYQFISDLNASDRSNLYLNFHPDCINYGPIQDPTYFTDHSFPPVLNDPTPYSIVPGTLNSSNESAVTAQLIGPDTFSPGLPLTITCTMQKYGNDWQIRVLDLEGYGLVVQ